jgi:hypothetical protein
LDGHINIIKKNREVLLEASTEVGRELNTEKLNISLRDMAMSIQVMIWVLTQCGDVVGYVSADLAASIFRAMCISKTEATRSSETLV